MQLRRTPIRVTLESGELTVVADAEGFSQPVRDGVGDDVCKLCAGDRWAFPLRPDLVALVDGRMAKRTLDQETPDECGSAVAHSC